MTPARAAVLAALLLVVATPVALGANGKPDNRSASRITIAVIGDTPYGDPQIANFRSDVREINRDASVRLVIHLGDIKNGSSRCDTSYFAAIKADFDAFKDPLIYTPGDNEWTDCHRANNGGFTPTERLTELRDIFFPDPGQSLGRRSRVLDAQSVPFVENVRWSQSRIEFGTLHVVGSNNDWLPWFEAADRSDEQVDEYVGRNAASLEWLDHIFDAAERHRARAVVLGIQADLWDRAFSGPNDDPDSYDHYTAFVQALADRASAFAKPVLLLNGDSHVFVDDRPLGAQAPAYQKAMYGLTENVPNLRRITVNGSTTPCHEWLRLTVDPRSNPTFDYDRVEFSIQPGFDPSECPAR
jgi:hypothetical protein